MTDSEDYGLNWTVDDLVDELGWTEVDRLIAAASKIQNSWRVKRSIDAIRSKVGSIGWCTMPSITGIDVVRYDLFTKHAQTIRLGGGTTTTSTLFVLLKLSNNGPPYKFNGRDHLDKTNSLGKFTVPRDGRRRSSAKNSGRLAAILSISMKHI